MLIEEYFQQIREEVESCQKVKSFAVNFQKRDIYEGFIRGTIDLINSSILHFREFVNVEPTIERGRYSYQYMDMANHLIFRYDNAEHHQKLNLPNFPHHKHQGSEENIMSSNAPMLVDVLKEIDALFR